MTALLPSPLFHVPPGAHSSDLAVAIRTHEPAAAHSLFERYATGLRFYLHRNHPEADSAEFVFNVLLEVARIVRRNACLDSKDITALVLTCARRQSRELPTGRKLRPADLNLQQRSEKMNLLLTSLSIREREVLLRTFLLLQRDRAIAIEMAVPVSWVREIRAYARAWFQSIFSHPTARVIAIQ